MTDTKHRASTKGQSYMERLNQWTAQHITGPLREAYQEYDANPNEVSEDEREQTLDKKLAAIESAIRGKVLESYRNGQKAGPRPDKKGSK